MYLVSQALNFLSVFDNRQLTDSSSKSVDNVFTEARLDLVAALPNKTNYVQLDTELKDPHSIKPTVSSAGPCYHVIRVSPSS